MKIILQQRGKVHLHYKLEGCTKELVQNIGQKNI